MTNFPNKGDDKAVSFEIRTPTNQAFAERLKAEHQKFGKPVETFAATTFVLWGRAREGADTAGVLAWIKEREAWAARHYGDGSQFPEDKPTMSNIAGVEAAIKWGVILGIGEKAMKNAVRGLTASKDERASVVR